MKIYSINNIKRRLVGFNNYADEIPFIQQAQTLYCLKLQIYIISENSVQPSHHTLVKRKRKGGAKMRKLEYSFEQLDIFLDSQQAELTISIAMLTSLLKRELLTQQQYNDCVTKLEQLYTA